MPATDEIYTPLYSIPTRVCLRCRQPIHGWGFYSLYGYILVARATNTLEKIHGCGEPVHYHCPTTPAAREIFRDDAMSDYAIHVRNVAPGIDFNNRTGRYNARVDKKRLGSHSTIELAQAARETYLKNTHATPHGGRRKNKFHGGKRDVQKR